jgi:hypothetical protein
MLRLFVGDLEELSRAAFPSTEETAIPVLCHPRMYKLCIDMLRRKASSTEIWIRNNNPTLADALTADEVIVVHKGIFRPLSSHPEWNEWKDVCSPGEFWTMVGEDWIG